MKAVVHDVPPYLRVYEDGTVERFIGTETTPAAVDPHTGVSSKDVLFLPESGVSARLYRPINPAGSGSHKKLPLVVYFHGGAFCISSSADPKYHDMLNILVNEAQILLVSVDYRIAPENPLPTAYEDSWAALVRKFIVYTYEFPRTNMLESTKIKPKHKHGSVPYIM